MRHSRRILCGLLLMLVTALTVCLDSGSTRAGELAEPAWREAKKEAKSLMKTPGYRFRKEEYVAQVSRDNSRRAAELLVQWNIRSLKYQQGKLEKALDKAKKAYDKAEAKKDRDKKSFKRAKEAFDKARKHYEAETYTRYHIGEGLAAISNKDAIQYLIDSGLPTLRKQKGAVDLQVIVARSLLKQDEEMVKATALSLAKDASAPKLRVLGINWIGQNQHDAGFDALLAAVKTPPIAVQRAAVRAFQSLDERRCVKPLIDAMQEANGLLRAEIDHLLHRFTGKTFESSAETWKRWWAREGTAWMELPDPKRFTVKKEQKKGGTMVRFYGIPTPSHHVVFVVDRSKSMEEKAVGGGTATTGKKRGAQVAGDTKMEVAKNQLALSIDELDRRVNFAVVFYSNDVSVWKPAPQLVPATPQNKKAAQEWIKSIKPYGPTLTFGALTKGLEYSDRFGGKKPGTGADTIFLLSDGSPTTADSRILEGEELEQAYKAFIQKNEIYHCVVHTIGIGPGHNRSVLKRLAKDTGGTYMPVGDHPEKKKK